MDDVEMELRDVLSQLGKGGVHRVAQRLERMGAYGFIHDAASCPVAQYIRHHTGRMFKVEGTAISLDGHVILDRDEYPAVDNFIKKFDDGEFPNLLACNQ